MKTEDKNLWRHVKTIIHDALRYKKVNKKKCDTRNIFAGLRNISAGLRNSVITFGTIACILLTAGIALADPVADNDWNIPDANPSLVGSSSEQITVDANPAAETRLTYNNAYDRQPSWSRDGQWVAFASTRGGSWDIWKVSKNGEAAGVARLTTYGGFDLEPNWNPSNKIVFAAGSGQGYEDVYTMNSDGTGRTRLTTAADFDEYADWSPDGSKIVYVSVGGQPGGAKQIWLMNADGTNKHRLNTEYAIQPAWSPDGTKIAFKCYRGGYNICVMNADGTNVRQLTSESVDTHDPDWTPDSSKIIYSSRRDGDFEIYIMNADGTNKRQLTNNVGINDDFPSISPDGQNIVFSSTRSGNQEIWTMPYSSGPISTSIAVTTPNGGENLVRGTTKAIRWSYTGNPGALKIELLKAGVLNRVIASSISVGTSGLGSYNWVIPSTQTLGNDYKIRVTSTSNSAYTDMSNSNFIIGNPYITVVSPNGGDSWTRGSARTISWTSAGITGSYVKIELYKSGVLNRIISSSTPNDGSYSWTVPSTQTLGSDYKIRVTSTTNAAYADISNNYFRIL